MKKENKIRESLEDCLEILLHFKQAPDWNKDFEKTYKKALNLIHKKEDAKMYCTRCNDEIIKDEYCECQECGEHVCPECINSESICIGCEEAV